MQNFNFQILLLAFIHHPVYAQNWFLEEENKPNQNKIKTPHFCISQLQLFRSSLTYITWKICCLSDLSKDPEAGKLLNSSVQARGLHLDLMSQIQKVFRLIKHKLSVKSVFSFAKLGKGLLISVGLRFLPENKLVCRKSQIIFHLPAVFPSLAKHMLTGVPLELAEYKESVQLDPKYC